MIFGVAYLIRATSIQILMHFYFLLYKYLKDQKKTPAVFNYGNKRYILKVCMGRKQTKQ